MKAGHSTTNAELISVMAVLISVGSFAAIAFTESFNSTNAAAWLQAIGSVLAIVAAVLISRHEAKRAYLQEQERRQATRRALAIQLSQEVSQKKDEIATQLQTEIFPQSISFRWNIPTFLAHGRSFIDFVDLGDDFMRIAAQLRSLDKKKQDHASGLSPEHEMCATPAETEWRKNHVSAVLLEITKLDELLSAVVDAQ